MKPILNEPVEQWKNCDKEMNESMNAEYTKKIISTSGKTEIASNPHIRLIETICDDVLPNMVRLYESRKMSSALDRDQFEKLIEQKVERANKSLKMLSIEDQPDYRAKIDRAYAENIDRLHGIPEWKNSDVREVSYGSVPSR